MAEDDIYRSKAKYESFKENLKDFLLPHNRRKNYRGGPSKYICKNPDNLEHFIALFSHFEAKDLSYIRRIRIIQSLRFICHQTDKNLKDCTRDDVNKIVAEGHKVYLTPKSKQTFIWDLKYFWKTFFPENDINGRPDETIVPYPVRHLSARIDKSQKKIRKDKLLWEEFEKIVDYFGNDPRIQAFLTLSLESLARPQELLYVKIGNIEVFDNYAKILISEHGKEGPGLLQCIDSYPYLQKWLNAHPLKKDKEAFLFINVGCQKRLEQLRPKNINQLIRKACKDLNIDKPITCYSLKRNGVTIRRLRGESDMEIQHAARWASTKQLKTYDMSNQEEAFKRELEKRGLVPSENKNQIRVKKCFFCNKTAGFGEISCPQCKRPLDRSSIEKEIKQKDQEISELKTNLGHLGDKFEGLKDQLLSELMKEILKSKKKSKSKSWVHLQGPEKVSSFVLEDGVN